jgi:hypothetical protein
MITNASKTTIASATAHPIHSAGLSGIMAKPYRRGGPVYATDTKRPP